MENGTNYYSHFCHIQTNLKVHYFNICCETGVVSPISLLTVPSNCFKTVCYHYQIVWFSHSVLPEHHPLLLDSLQTLSQEYKVQPFNSNCSLQGHTSFVSRPLSLQYLTSLLRSVLTCFIPYGPSLNFSFFLVEASACSFSVEGYKSPGSCCLMPASHYVSLCVLTMFYGA